MRLTSATALATFGLLAATTAAGAAQPAAFLDGIRRHTTLTSTVPDSGDQNPYAIVVAPVTAGAVHAGDVLVTNFNNGRNLQGTGTTIMRYTPGQEDMQVFASLPAQLPQCPGGVGLSAAMTMLRSGWVIVGSAPSRDGTTATKGQGCLLVLDAQGKLAGVLDGADINAPWGNMAVIDRGDTATLFVSNAGFSIGSAAGEPPVVKEATVLRLDLAMQGDRPPVVTGRTVVASGFGAQADKDVFLVGPTGLALGPNGSLFVSDAIGNRVCEIWDAATRGFSAGIGRVVTGDGLLQRPLAMVMAPNGHLLVTNGLNGQVVEIEPRSGTQVAARWIDQNKAQTPPGSGDLFGIAMHPDGQGFYFVRDEENTLVLAQ